MVTTLGWWSVAVATTLGWQSVAVETKLGWWSVHVVTNLRWHRNSIGEQVRCWCNIGRYSLYHRQAHQTVTIQSKISNLLSVLVCYCSCVWPLWGQESTHCPLASGRYGCKVYLMRGHHHHTDSIPQSTPVYVSNNTAIIYMLWFYCWWQFVTALVYLFPIGHHKLVP